MSLAETLLMLATSGSLWEGVRVSMGGSRELPFSGTRSWTARLSSDLAALQFCTL